MSIITLSTANAPTRAPKVFIRNDATLLDVSTCAVLMRPGTDRIASDYSTWTDLVGDEVCAERLPASSSGTSSISTLGLGTTVAPDQVQGWTIPSGLTPTGDFTVAFACALDDVSAIRNFLRSATGINIYFAASTGTMNVYVAADTPVTATITDPTEFAVYTVGYTDSTNAITIRRNKVQIGSGTGATSPAAASHAYLCYEGTNGAIYFLGDAGTMAIYSENLHAAGNETDLETVEEYLRQLYRLP